MSRLVNLQILELSENPIETFDSVSEIIRLTNLKKLSFECEHFGSCPVVEIPGYRNYVLSTLQNKSNFRILDSISVY